MIDPKNPLSLQLKRHNLDWIYFLDLFGTLVFAISGVLTSIEKKFDLVGSIVIGFVTAIGGGTLRDILIGKFPVGWLIDRNYMLVIIVGCLLSYLFRSRILKWRKSMFIFDTIGIGLFTILGIKTSLSFGLSVEVCLIMGVVSAVFGGVIRDVLTNEIPLIFRKEIYATACLAGGVVYLLLVRTTGIEDLGIVISMLVVMIIRYFAVKRGWTLQLG